MLYKCLGMKNCVAQIKINKYIFLLSKEHMFLIMF